MLIWLRLIFLVGFLKLVKSSTDILEGLTEVDLKSMSEFILQPRARVVCFYKTEGPSLQAAFLRELREAAQYFNEQHEYGIIIAKVNCGKEHEGYCDNEFIRNHVMAFRGNQKVALATSALPDRHAIIASILHLSLVEEVPIVRSLAERRRLSEACANDGYLLLFLYVTQLGTYEHRVFMELALALLRETTMQPKTSDPKEEKWLCAVTASADVTRGLQRPSSWEEDGEGSEALLWALRCLKKDLPESCKSYLHWGALDLLQVTAFVEAFSKPRWDQSLRTRNGHLVSSFDDLGLPTAFVMFAPEDSKMYQEAQACANKLSEWFRGSMAISLLSYKDVNSTLRRKWSLDESLAPAVVFVDKVVEESVMVNGYCASYDFVRELLDSRRRLLVSAHREDIHIHQEEDPIPQLVQDDPVALASSRLTTFDDSERLSSLTDKTIDFHLQNNAVTPIFFYLSWDPASTLSESFLKKALRKLTLVENRNVAKVDCFNWTDICQKYDITSFPMLIVFRNQRITTRFSGLWQIKTLTDFLIMTVIHENPIQLGNWEEAVDFLEGRGHFADLRSTTLFLAAFQEKDDERLISYKNIADIFTGRNLFAVAYNHLASKIASYLKTKVPLMAAVRPEDYFNVSSLLPHFESNFSVQRLTFFVEENQLQTFPELNSRSFSALWRVGKPLGLLIREDGCHHTSFSLLGTMVSRMRNNLPFPFTWMHRNSSLANKVLNALGLAPNDSALLVVDVNKVFVYNGSWDIIAIQEWIMDIQEGRAVLSVPKSNSCWRPRQKDFDFLAKMEADEKYDEEYLTSNSYFGEEFQQRLENSLEFDVHHHTEL